MNYLQHWGLRAPPFADDDAFVPLASAQTALAKLRFGASDGAVAALVGPAGTGKSLLLRRLADEFAQAGWLALYLPRPAGAPGDWLARVDPLGAVPRRPGQSDFSALEDALAVRHEAGQRVLVAVDDLQTARDTAPGDLMRALCNLSRDGQRLIHLVLAGQNGWPAREALLDGLATFCSVTATLRPLSPEECRQYLLARFAAAGARRGLLTRKAADAMARAARGVARDLNRVAELSLVAGYGLGATKITPDLAEMAAADLGLPAAGPTGSGGLGAWPDDNAQSAADAVDVLSELDEIDILASLGEAAP